MGKGGVGGRGSGREEGRGEGSNMAVLRPNEFLNGCRYTCNPMGMAWFFTKKGTPCTTIPANETAWIPQ